MTYDELSGSVSAFGGLGRNFGRLGASFGVLGKVQVAPSGTPTGDGTMDFSISTGDDTGLLALLEDI